MLMIIVGSIGIALFKRNSTTCLAPPMPKMRRKSDLPTKVCAHCGREFTWRKKWERVWAEVKYCSQACRRLKGSVD